MGVYDSVWFPCPICGTEIEFQSKAGSCCLGNYHSRSVPVAIASDLMGEREECDCGEVIELGSNLQSRVSMTNVFDED